MSGSAKPLALAATFVALLTATGGLRAATPSGPTLTATTPAASVANVAAATATPGPLPAADGPVRALLVADRETTLAASMTGRLLDLVPRPGERVRKGQIVARFECSEAQARRDMALAELESARLAHDGKIRLQGLQSVSELEVELAAAAVSKAQAQVGVAKAQLAQCSVAAPFAGWVVKWHAKPFQGVTVGAPLLEIVSDAPPRVKLNVPSAWLSWLKSGAQFEIDIEETGKRYAAQLRQINGRVDPVSQTIAVEAQLLKNDPELLPGMSGPALLAPRK